MPLSAITISRPSPFVITKGIKYIKINRFDKQGNDNTLSLQELTSVRLRFDDFGVVEFPILTIAEYPDYYLYRTANVTFGNSTEGFYAPINPSPALTLNGGDSSGIVSGYTDVTGSIDGSGLYTFINGGYGVTIDYSFLSIGDTTEYIQVIFTGSNGIIHSQTFNNESLFGGQIQSASFTYVPTSGSTLGMMFSASASNMSPTYVILSASYGNSGFNIVQDITASINNNILDHTIETSKTGTTIVAGDASVIVTNYSTVTTDTLGYFNSTTGLITFGDTPNIKINVTASVTVPDVYQDFSLFGSSEGRIVMVNTSNPSGGTLTLSASITPIENSTYWLFVENNAPGASSYSNVNLLLTQSVDPVSSSILTILEPYLTTNFFYDDCNALYGNGAGLEYDADFMKVNYDGDGGNVIPSNQQQILTNTAERAPVKSYNYTLRAQTLPRYEGVRTTSPGFNLNTITANTYEDCNVNSIGTGEPNVQSLGTYFAYFDWIGGTTPELIGKSGIHIVYLIDKDGNTLTPTISSSYYYNLIDNFETDKNIKINLNSISAPSNVEIKRVLRPGATPWGIIASQTGSGYNVQPEMYFNDANLPDPPQYSSVYTTNQSPTGMGDTISLDLAGTTIPSAEITLSSGGNYLEITGATSNLTLIALQLRTTLGCYQVNSNPPNGNTITTIYTFQKSSDSGASWSNVGTHYVNTTYGQAQTQVNITSNYFTPQSSDRFRCIIYNPSGYFVSVTEAGNFNIVQNPQSSANAIAYASLNYWVTGSLSKNILTGSQFFQIYQSPTSYQQNYLNSGYNNFLNFNLQYADEIRFQGDENQLYSIIDTSLSGSALYLTLNRDIVDGTDLNSFLIRRYQPNPNFVTIDWDLNNYSGGGGFIFPEYSTNELTQNFDTVIKNLKEKGLIPS